LTPLCFRERLSILPNGAPKAHHAREDAKRLALAVSLLIEEQPA
jgi:hypothetical protein